MLLSYVGPGKDSRSKLQLQHRLLCHIQKSQYKLSPPPLKLHLFGVKHMHNNMYPQHNNALLLLTCIPLPCTPTRTVTHPRKRLRPVHSERVRQQRSALQLRQQTRAALANESTRCHRRLPRVRTVLQVCIHTRVYKTTWLHQRLSIEIFRARACFESVQKQKRLLRHLHG